MFRLSRRMTQEQLAKESGMSRVFLSALERGLHAPNVVLLRRLARALNAPLALVLDEAEDPSPAPHTAVRAGRVKSAGCRIRSPGWLFGRRVIRLFSKRRSG
jgi:transcriptional regulator with XRE-family HTH domain